MGRHCKQHLATAHEVEAGSPGIDVVWVESLLEFPNIKEDALGELASISCALVSFVQTPKASAHLSLLAASMTGVRTRRQRCRGPDWAEEFALAIRSRDDDFASFVVLLDDGSSASQDVQKVVDALRTGNPDTTGLIVGVSGRTDGWGDLKGIDGFVLAEEGGSAAVATSLCVALASIAAPFLWTCVDVEDLRRDLGGPGRPSSLVEVSWVRDRDELLFASEADRHAAHRCPSAAMFLFVDESDIALTRDAVRAVRRHMPDACHLIYQVAVDFLVRQMASSKAVPITLICRPANRRTTIGEPNRHVRRPAYR